MPGRLSDLAAVTATEASSLSTVTTAGASSPATSSSYGDFSVGKRRASGCGERALVGGPAGAHFLAMAVKLSFEGSSR